ETNFAALFGGRAVTLDWFASAGEGFLAVAARPARASELRKVHLRDQRTTGFTGDAHEDAVVDNRFCCCLWYNYRDDDRNGCFLHADGLERTMPTRPANPVAGYLRQFLHTGLRLHQDDPPLLVVLHPSGNAR